MQAMEYSVQRVTWQDAHQPLSAVRRDVFVVEQRVPEDLEWDGDDAGALHVLASAGDGTPIGTGRLLPDGRIGRMAVLRPWRGRGVGSAILAALVTAARERGDRLSSLHAQTHALGFYARYGFVAIGPEFMEAGIPHRQMMLTHRP